MRELNPQRTFALVKNRLRADFTPLLLGASILLGLELVFLVIQLLWGHRLERGQQTNAMWPQLVVLASFLTSARAFAEMQSGKSATDWLLLPASSGEKYLAALLSTQVLVPVVGSVVGLALWAISGPVVFPEYFGQWQLWGVYLTMNLVFFAGSTVFRKLAFFKTAGAWVAFALVLVLLFGLFAQLLPARGPREDFYPMEFMTTTGNPAQFLTWFWSFGVFCFTPVAALLFSWFRVQEKEARDAVQ